MKNRMLLIFLAMVLVVSLAAFVACKAEEAPPPVEEEAPPEEGEGEVWQWPETIFIGSIGVEATSYALAIAWGTPFGQDTGVTTRVVFQPDMNITYQWLKSGRINITTLKQSGKPWIETEAGTATRDGGPVQFRGVMVSSKRDAGWATTKDSPIYTPEDIKPGTRIIYSAYLGPIEISEPQMAFIAWAQVDPEDIVWVPSSSYGGTARLLMDGKADVVYVEMTSHSMWLEAEASPRGLRFIDLNTKANPEGAERYKEQSPTATFAIITVGCPASLGHYGMTVMGPYLVMDSTDPELTYHLAKWFHEKYDLYKDTHPICAGMTIENSMVLAETYYIPMHEGMVRYLKELGVWTPAAESNQQENIELITMYSKAYQQAIAEADSRGIEVNPTNKEWIKLWFSYRDILPRLEVKEYFHEALEK